jgi:hypothetical protein
MSTKALMVLTLAGLLGWSASTSGADDPKLPDVKTFDKAVIDSLRAVHNKGADLYNKTEDHAGAYRLYQGALETVQPLLAHRPEAQKIITDGLAAAEKETTLARKAFVLHETIESVRKQLKIVNGLVKPDNPPEKKPDEKKGKENGNATASGNVTLGGKPLAAGSVTVVKGSFPFLHTFTAEVKDGAFKFAETIPTGKYMVTVSGAGVPQQFQSLSTSALQFEFAAGANQMNLELK